MLIGERWKLTAKVIVTFGLVTAICFLTGLLVINVFYKQRPVAAARAPRVEPVVDEEQKTAGLPLTEVLALDFTKSSQAYLTFDNTIKSRLRHRRFKDLDTFAALVRANKARVPGGGWQLHRMYTQLEDPAEGEDAPDDYWFVHLHLLEEWVKAMPQSITARVAYAGAMNSYAWHARGSHFANEVGDEEWKLFFDRLHRAEKILLEGWYLPERCPEWYAVMQGVALGLSYDRATYDKIYKAAVDFEPLYKAYYSAKVTYLLPRWHGKDGEWAEFLADASDRIGGAEGSAMFYNVFAYAEGVVKEDEIRPLAQQYWPRVKRGYSDTAALYYVTPEIANAFCRLAYLADDPAAARAEFERIGDNWTPRVWGTRAEFDRVKNWSKLERETRLPAGIKVPARTEMP